MSDLANYSIETDHVVLLSFKDGRKLRVPFEQLSRYLRPRDLDTVKKSISLRRHFIRDHMPRAAVIIAAVGGLLALLTIGGKTVASLVSHPRAPQPAPQRTTGIARSQELPTPQLPTAPQQNMQTEHSDAKLTSASISKKVSSHAAVPKVKGKSALHPEPHATPLQQVISPVTQAVSHLTGGLVNVATDNSSQPAQSPSPSPSASPSPSPSQSPGPAGQVLGSSTQAN